MSNKGYEGQCPYCNSEDVTFLRDIDDTQEAVNSEKYVCNGICEKTFYVQKDDNMLIMTPTMRSEYLDSKSFAFNKKKKLETEAVVQGVPCDLTACGNCVSYEWGENSDGKVDRHNGKCFFQQGSKSINLTISDVFIPGKLHALTKATSCDNFFNVHNQ